MPRTRLNSKDLGDGEINTNDLVDGAVTIPKIADATATPTASKIPIAGVNGKLALAWLSNVLASSDLTNDSALEKTANKGVASGYASLNSSSKVVQDPANATATPTASKIPIANGSGKLASGWLTAVLASSDLTNDSALEKVADKGTADGYASLDANTMVPIAQLPPNATRFVRVATTANITLSGTQTIDGISVIAGDRVFVWNQTTGSQNGIYVVAAGAWTRATDMATSAQTLTGMEIHVCEGTVNVDLKFILETDAPITLGTTALVFRNLNNNSDVFVAGQITTTSTTDVVMTSMTLTMPKGTYLFIFECLAGGSTTSVINTISMYNNGVQIADTVRAQLAASTTSLNGVSIHKVVTVDGVNAVTIRWKTSAGTAKVQNKHLMAIRLR